MIPNELFGGADRNPIIILDGTYLYVQKSYNYLYQKDTYSLHKYRNLIKLFMMVCSDGYIIDKDVLVRIRQHYRMQIL